MVLGGRGFGKPDNFIFLWPLVLGSADHEIYNYGIAALHLGDHHIVDNFESSFSNPYYPSYIESYSQCVIVYKNEFRYL